MTRTRVPVRLFLAALALAGCGLNPNALYRCEADSSCPLDGYTCWSDGYCHPPSDGAEDAGGLGGGGGMDAGGGTGGGGDDAGLDDGGAGGGGQDAGGDAGAADGGTPDAGCVPAITCPGTVQCGFVDAGCGLEVDCGRCASPMECGVVAPNTCALPRVCTENGVCWEHPLPQGNTLRAGWPIDARRAWLAGDNGTLLQWTGERTLLTPAPPLAGSDVTAVHGVSPTEAFAVGTRGLLLAWNGARWQAEQVSTGYSGAFNAVAALGSGLAVAVGPSGLVVWRDPQRPGTDKWLIDASIATSTNLSAVAAAQGSVFVAANRTIHRATSATSGWTVDAMLSGGGPVTELVESGGVLYALQSGLFDGGMGVRLTARASAGGWTPTGDAPVPARTLRASADALWLAGANTVTVLAKDGGLLAPALVPGGMRDFYALAPLADGRAIVAGVGGLTGFLALDAGYAEHFQQNTRLRLGKLCAYPTPGGPVVVATSATPACPNGCQARVVERRETTRGYEWTPVDVGIPTGSSGEDTLACHLESATLGWATTTSRYVLHRTASGGWATADLGSSFNNDWYGVWGPPGGPWYFVGDNGSGAVLKNFDGGVASANFVVQYIGNYGRMRALAGVARDNAVAIGTLGTFGRLQSNSNWSGTSNGPNSSATMTAIAGAGFADGGVFYVAAGLGGQVWTLRNNASNFSVAPGLPQVDYRDVWVAPSGDAVLVGDGGVGVEPPVVWLSADGGVGTVNVPTDVVLHGVFGWPDTANAANQVWVTGDNGVVLTFTR